MTGRTRRPVRPLTAPRRRPSDVGLADLPFRFADQALIESIGPSRRARLARPTTGGRLRAFDALPVEPNRLYTPYIDLRPARADGRPSVHRDGGDRSATGSCRPDAARTRPRPDRVARGRRRGPRLSEAGTPRPASILETLGALGRATRRGPRAARGRPGVAADGRQVRPAQPGLWNQGIVLRVPAGVRSTQPIVLRWRVGAPGSSPADPDDRRARRGRRGASLLEELRRGPGACAAGEPAPGLFTGTIELHLGARREPRRREPPGLGPRPDRVPASTRAHRRRRRPPLGPRPARRAPRPLARRQPARSATAARSSRSRSSSAATTSCST